MARRGAVVAGFILYAAITILFLISIFTLEWLVDKQDNGYVIHYGLQKYEQCPNGDCGNPKKYDKSVDLYFAEIKSISNEFFFNDRLNASSGLVSLVVNIIGLVFAGLGAVTLLFATCKKKPSFRTGFTTSIVIFLAAISSLVFYVLRTANERETLGGTVTFGYSFYVVAIAAILGAFATCIFSSDRNTKNKNDY